MKALYRPQALDLSRRHFINSYPPFNVARRHQTDDLRELSDLALYVHIPFCPTICSYCYYKKYGNPTSSAIAAYLRQLKREIELFAADPALRDKVIRSLYIGGGTPTVLTSKEIEDLVEWLRQHLDLSQLIEFCCEAKPDERTMTAEKLATLKALGVTRLSFGIESLNPEVLSLHNRRCHKELYYRSYRQACETGFAKINVDVMSGMPGETWESWKSLVDTLLEWAPPAISIYKTEVFYNTPLFAALRSGKARQGLMSDEEEIEQVSYAHRRLQCEGGYVVANCLHLVRDWGYADLHYKSIWEGAELKGLGLSAHSCYEGVLHQNASELHDYHARLARGELPIYRSYRMNARDRISQAMVYGLKNLEISRSRFAERFGFDLMDVYSKLIDELIARGVLSLDDEWLRVTPDYYIYADDVCRQFFLPEYDQMMLAHLSRPRRTAASAADLELQSNVFSGPITP